jgi:hypothetical protein
LAVVNSKEIPRGIPQTHAWLKQIIPASKATLDENGIGRPEGVVVREADRSAIAKIRFEDYERHARNSQNRP